MQLDPSLVTDLRVMFLNGATPARLVQHVATRYPDDPIWPFSAEEYFAEAFQIGVILHKSIDSADVDADLLRDMVGRCHLWRDAVAHLVPLGSAWCDELTISPDELKMIEAIRPETYPALAEVWATLPTKAQHAIRQSMVNAQAYYERAQILAHLAGRLQERVAEREEVAAAPS